ncbi:hypothetical protein FACS189483_05410 [Spirochaetia bacterium]|nr:hypothetical protein FACS189483_05410 [Spirochaetia bacterium]
MYTHPKMAEFTRTLEALFHEVDDDLEDLWGQSFALHPNRPGRGETSNPEMDGLFNIVPDFTVGLGSEQGRGYSISLKVATLETVTPEQFEYLMTEAAILISGKLLRYFPDRELKVVRDGKRFKLIGDFSLGNA